MKLIKNMKIKSKILLLVSLVLLVLSGVNLYFSISNQFTSAEKEIKNFKEKSLSEAEKRLEMLVDTLTSSLKDKNDDEIFSIINNTRYDNENGYYWINDFTQPIPHMIYHPIAKQLNGNTLDNSAYNLIGEEKRNFFSVLAEKTEKNGSGFVQYLWPKPGEKDPQPKLSFGKKLNDKYLLATGFYIDDINKNVLIKEKEIRKEINNTIIVTIIITFIILIISMIIMYIIADNISRNIKEVSDISKDLAEGDLTLRLDTNTKDEVGIMNKNLNFFLEKLKDIVSQIKFGTNSIAGSVTEINNAMDDLAIKASVQANSLEETSATMEELSSIIIQNYDSAKNVDELTKSTREKTEKVGVFSHKFKTAMNEISESSNKIINIIDVIDEIAFQTNLLALNAAVEAARAGETGRGFAVVAVEIRNLAGRSSNAAKEIKNLINESVEKVEQGNLLADTAIENINEIVKDVKSVSKEINNLTLSAKEQRTGVEEINKAVLSLDEITQTNAGIAEETAAATTKLKEQSDDFKKLVEYFKLDDNE